jgi:hypothetical protein
MVPKVLGKLGIAVAAVTMFAFAAGASTVSVTFTGTSGHSQGGVDTDPYYGTVNGVQNVPIVCDDFSHHVTSGEMWTANVSTFNSLTYVRFQQATQAQTLQLYEEAGWLFDQLFVSGNSSQTGNISYALWAIFDSGQVEGSSGWTTGGNSTNPTSANGWLHDAENQTFYAGEFSNLEILTPVSSGSNSPQEYITFAPTPEPTSLLLLASGLFAVAFLVRKKANSSATLA